MENPVFFFHIRRPRPEPWPGRRLGPPLVWTSSAAKLGAVASQVFLFLLARNCRMLPWKPRDCRMLPSNAPQTLETLQTPRNVQTGSWSCQATGCGKPSLSFSTGPKLPDAPFKRFKRSKRSKPLETYQTGSWSCHTRGCGKPSLSFSTGSKLPDAPFKRFKRSKRSKPLATSKPALGAAKLGAVGSQAFLFWC